MEQQEQPEKQRRARVKIPITERAILPKDFPTNVPSAFYIDEQGEYQTFPIEIRQMKLMKTDKEKKEARRIYRKEYMSRPASIEKMKQRMSDPEFQKKKKEYSARQDVKERKKELSAKNRLVKKCLMEKYPAIYDELLTNINT